MVAEAARLFFAALVAFALGLNLYCPQCAPEHLGENAELHETACQVPGQAPTHLPDDHDLTAVWSAAPANPTTALCHACVAPAVILSPNAYAPPVRPNDLPPPRPALLGLRTTILRC